jgi:hypothetical protein
MGLRLFQCVQLFPVRHDRSAKQGIPIFAGNASVSHPDKSPFSECGFGATRAESHIPTTPSEDVAVSKNLQVCNSLTGLYSANSKLAGAYGDPPRQTSRALRNPHRYWRGRNGRGLQSS